MTSRRPIFRRWCLAWFMLGAIVAAAWSAGAAVRVCSEPLSSEVAIDPTEQGARKKAIENWIAKAELAGYEGALWRTAYNKLLKCLRTGDAFECVAVARACRVSQVPPRPRPANSPAGVKSI